MGLQIDPQVGAALAALFGEEPQEPPPAGDVDTRRTNFSGMLEVLNGATEIPDDVSTQDFSTTTKDGHELLLRWFVPAEAGSGSAIYYTHGGGMIVGSVDLYDGLIKRQVKATGVPFLAVDYRLAPEFPHPTPVEDCYAGLGWMFENAAQLGIDPSRIAIMGDSAGGGLAAGVALMARDRGGPTLAKQILIYPMLDDRNTVPDEAIVPFLIWSYDDNRTGWGALLGSAMGTASVSPYAAPARAEDLSGLPPAYIDVGDLDAFRDEDVAYAQRLVAAGVPTEFHLHPGCPHAFEALAPEAEVSKRVMADRFRAVRGF